MSGDLSELDGERAEVGDDGLGDVVDWTACVVRWTGLGVVVDWTG